MVTLFLVLSLLTVLSALCVVFTRNLIYSVLSLIVCFFAIAGHYVLLKASFLAVIQVIVYAGAIMVLFLFMLMLMNLNKKAEASKPFSLKVVAVGVCLLVLVALVSIVFLSAPRVCFAPLAPVSGSVSALGPLLFNEYAIPFELTSILFLSAVAGVVMIGSYGKKAKKQ